MSSALAQATHPRHWWLWVAAGLIAMVVGINQSAIHWRDNNVDSHLFAWQGWCVLHGARPYLDVWDNKPPGIWWVNAAGFALCGPGVRAEILISAFAMVAILAAFVALARAAFHPSIWPLALLAAGVVFSHPRWECGANRTETFVIACEITAVLGYVRWLRTGRTAWLLLAGLAAGAAPWFKQSGLASTAACGLHLLWIQFDARRSSTGPAHLKPSWRPWLIGGAAAAIVHVAAIAVLAAQGSLSAAWFAVATFNQAYFAVDDATWLHMPRALAVYLPAIRPLTELLAFVAIGFAWLVVASFRRRPGRDDRSAKSVPALLFWLWLLLAAYLACVGPGRQGHHMLPTLPPLVLLALLPIDRLANRRGIIAALRPSSAVVLVVFCLSLIHLASDAAPLLRRCWNRKPTWHSLQRNSPEPGALRAARIDQLAQPDDTIYVWGWDPSTYHYAYRKSPSRFATLEKLGQVGSHAQFIVDGAIVDIMRSPPAVLVISTGDLAAMRAQPNDRFGQWVSRNYVDDGVIDGMHLLAQTPPAPAPQPATDRHE